MIRYLKRAAVAVALIAWCAPAFAVEFPGKEMVLPSSDHPVKVIQFKAPGGQKRPAALLLHGAGSFDRRIAEYNSYASTLAGAGIDAYLVYYYSEKDAMYGGGDFEYRYPFWAKLVADLGDDVRAMPDSNGKVGLVGFSNGGILASGAAAIDPKLTAAVIYYGTEPWPLQEPVRHYPPLLILHGDNDEVIPVAAGKRLAANAKALGATVDLVIYPGGKHGFGSDIKGKNGSDALARTVAFLTQQLITK